MLHDVDNGRLDAIVRVLRAQAGDRRDAPRIVATTDLTEALTGAAFVFSAIRVGGLAGRVADEQIALRAGVLGQETVGAGGISYALRTVPAAEAIARHIARIAPDAWVINFTNPAGLVTEAMAAHLGNRVIGICDSPSALARRVLRALAPVSKRATGGGVRVEYAGLNHLGWLTAVRGPDGDLLPGLLADSGALESFEEGRLFGADRLRQLAAIPNEYLRYYEETEALVRAESRAPQTRGQFLLEQQTQLYARLATAADPLAEWDGARRQRDATYMALEGLGERDEAEGGGYEEVALALMVAIARNEPAELIVNVRNRGTIGFLDDAAVVEVPCVVDGSGARPLPSRATIPTYGVDLVRRIKDVDRLILSAVSSGSRELAVRAMAAHPLIDSVPTARQLIDGYVGRFAELSYLR